MNNKLNQPFIVDIEASGLGVNSYPIEIGVALADGDKFCRLIQPVPSWTHWDEGAEKIHHISRDNLMEHGDSVVNVANALNATFEGKTLFSDGWGVDKPWLTTLFYAAGKTMLFTVSPIELILSEQQMALWHETKDHIIAETNLTRHRASNDAWLIQETYRRTLKAS